jgi:predicted ester cyclase
MSTWTMSLQRAEELVRLHFDYFNRHDLEEGVLHLTPDFEWKVVPFHEKFWGPKGYLESNRRWIKAFPDGKREITRVLTQGSTAVVEFRGKGTHSGPLEGSQVEIQPTGRSIDLPVIEVYEFKAERLNRGRTYFDSATMLRQLGVTL